MNCTSCGKNVRITLREDDRCVACRWIDAHQEVANQWFDGDLDHAERVLDALPYSKIPEWRDVDVLMKEVHSSS